MTLSTDFSKPPATVIIGDGTTPPAAPAAPPNADVLAAASAYITGGQPPAQPAQPAQPPAPAAPAAPQPTAEQMAWWASQTQLQQPQPQQPQLQAPPQGAWWQQPTQPTPAQPPAAPQPWFDPTAVSDYGIAPDVAARYSAAMPVIEAIVNSKLRAAEAAIRTRTSQLEQQVNGQFTTLAQRNDMMFADAVTTGIPDLATKRVDPGWGAYLGQRVPGTGQTVASLINSAYAAQDLESLRELVAGFHGTIPAAAPTTPAGAVSPFSNAAPQPAANAGNMLPLSRHSKAAQDYVRGSISLEVWNEIDRQYEAARANGMVDFNR